MKRIVKLLVSLIIACVDAASGFMRRIIGAGPRMPCIVLYYHAVPNQSANAFLRQMQILLRLAVPVRLHDIGTDGCRRRRACVTFDDGYLSVLKNAVPVMAANGIPAAVFVTTGSMGKTPGWIRDPNHPFSAETVLSEREVRELSDSFQVTIGSHGVNHTRLAAMREDVLVKEIADSKKTLEAVTGKPVEFLSFPHGAFDASAVAGCRQSSYARVFSIDPEPVPPDSRRYVIGRIKVDPTDWPLEFSLKLRGAYRWLSRQKHTHED